MISLTVMITVLHDLQKIITSCIFNSESFDGNINMKISQ
jgi:hypothetical protein